MSFSPTRLGPPRTRPRTTPPASAEKLTSLESWRRRRLLIVDQFGGLLCAPIQRNTKNASASYVACARLFARARALEPSESLTVEQQRLRRRVVCSARVCFSGGAAAAAAAVEFSLAEDAKCALLENFFKRFVLRLRHPLPFIYLSIHSHQLAAARASVAVALASAEEKSRPGTRDCW